MAEGTARNWQLETKMQDVPKIVRARLQRPTPATAEAHPDADLLTAFAERSLAGGERDHVLEHLARCADCRDVVALALPATEDVVLAKPATSPRRWLSLPVLRWGVVAAGVLALTSVGILQYRQRHQHQEETAVATTLTLRDRSTDSGLPSPVPTPQASRSFTSRTETGKQTVTERRAPAPLGSQNALSPEVSEGKSVPAPRPVFPQSQSTHHAASAGAFQGSIGGPVRGLGSDFGVNHGSRSAQTATPRGSSAFADDSKNTTSGVIGQQNPNLGASQRAPAASATTAVEVSGAAPLLTTQTTPQNQIQDQLVQNDASGPPSSADRVGKAKSASPQLLPMAPAPLLHAEPALTKSAAAPRWTISSSGALQRSFDGGNTWLDVDVAASEKKAAAKSMARSSAMATTISALAAHPVFRAVSVSSNAAEVWAGGSGGALYHTMDAGNRWVRVVPSQAGVLLAGDIIAIQFSDPRNGIVTTSTAEVWTTVDAGQNWHKQQ
jgi:Photosynthesis system II assembly factor YCF48/Putative zinc-finger